MPHVPPALPLPPGGLSEAEARARLARFGPNRVEGQEGSRIRELLGLLLDPMAVMLLAAAGLYFVLGEQRDALVLLGALVPVLGADVVLEVRARSALAALRTRVAPEARVVRDGTIVSIPAADVVPGDLLVLAEGDVLVADGIARVAANLAVDESSLTGESEPIAKRATDGPSGTLFAGSSILTGQGFAEVTATGMSTKYGDVARLVLEADRSATPIQRRTSALVRRLFGVAAFVAVAIVGLSLARGSSWAESVLGGLSLAIAAVPEEFPLVFALFLSLGAWRLGRRGVLVRRTASVETLGCTTVLCTDKTGTLTRGEFALDAVLPLDDAGEAALLEIATLACEKHPVDPMERAIAERAKPADIDVRFALLRDHDFDPIGKHMSHVWRPNAEPGVELVAAKGALEGVLEHCRIEPADEARAHEENAKLASRGMRVLAVAFRRGPANAAATRGDDETGLVLRGLLGFRDPLRPEVPAAVDLCQAAGIRIKLVTGDHPLTAHAIAEEAGIFHDDANIVTGYALDAMSIDERRARVGRAAVIARVTPAQKHAIVRLLREGGEIVAMTGDGINDAPALRSADVGISMGPRATEVARAASDLVLLEDDLGAITEAVRRGRLVFDEIQRAFLYLIAFHVPIVLLALFAPIAGIPLLLLPIHIVWLELIVHPISAFAFQSDERADDPMREPPRDPAAPLLPRAPVIRSVISGVLLSAGTGWLYAASLPDGLPHARGLALVALLAGVQLLVLAERLPSRDGGRLRVPRSPSLWVSWSIVTASIPAVFLVPGLRSLLDVAPLGPRDVALALGVAFASVGWRLVRGRHRRP